MCVHDGYNVCTISRIFLIMCRSYALKQFLGTGIFFWNEFGLWGTFDYQRLSYVATVVYQLSCLLLKRILICSPMSISYWNEYCSGPLIIMPNKKIVVVPVTRPPQFFTPSKKIILFCFLFVKWPPDYIFPPYKCNIMSPNALKMYIREVWFNHFENFNPTHFGFKFFIYDHEDSQIKLKKLLKFKKMPTYLPTYLPTYPTSDSSEGVRYSVKWKPGEILTGAINHSHSRYFTGAINATMAMYSHAYPCTGYLVQVNSNSGFFPCLLLSAER
jgi:hypothetical protein